MIIAYGLHMYATKGSGLIILRKFIVMRTNEINLEVG